MNWPFNAWYPALWSKDLEPGKWVRVASWVEAEDARREIMESAERFRKPPRKKK